MNLTKPLDCIIIDDEDGAHLVMESHLQGLKALNLCGNFYNAKDALDYMYKNHVDLIFLDINMPGLSGIEMLKAMSQPPLTILTTAYSQYALESYDYEVVDYLVKPISLPRFLVAVDRAIYRFRGISPVAQENTLTTAPKLLTLKVDHGYLRLEQREIDYVQSWGNYVKVFVNGQMMLGSMTTSEIENKLDDIKFLRIHKSYIVALDRIQRVKGNEAQLIGGTFLPIGTVYRKRLLESL